ncbi:MAG: MBL fold metallo-hydrolase [Bacteriovoracaceae bacterium]
MKIQVLGGHGGLAKGFATTSFLIDETLLLDAGAVAMTLTVEEQSKIDHILISHSHLDHIKDLAFLCDNCFGMRSKPFDVYTHATVKSLIKSHLFNDMIWPDFTALPTPKNPTMEFHAVEPEKEFHLGDYAIRGIKVKHQNDAMGFIIEKDNASVLFTVDTGPTERIWEIAHTVKNLRAIFTEVSFPNELQKVADLSDHHTPQSLNAEIGKMPGHVPIILTHLKPNFRDKIITELDAIGNKRIHVLEKDGEVFNY